jgi:hypothetical protein
MALLIEKYYKEPSSAPEAKDLISALSVQATPDSKIVNQNQDIHTRVLKLSSMAMEKAGDAGQASLKFFPAIPEKFLLFDGNASKKFMDSNYWNTVFQTGQGNSKGKQQYFGVVKDMYVPLGAEIRTVIKSAL